MIMWFVCLTHDLRNESVKSITIEAEMFTREGATILETTASVFRENNGFFSSHVLSCFCYCIHFMKMLNTYLCFLIIIFILLSLQISYVKINIICLKDLQMVWIISIGEWYAQHQGKITSDLKHFKSPESWLLKSLFKHKQKKNIVCNKLTWLYYFRWIICNFFYDFSLMFLSWFQWILHGLTSWVICHCSNDHHCWEGVTL